MKISHLKNKKLSMVDISKKSNTKREARAKSTILFRKKSYDFLRKEGSKKGEIFNVARTAGILAGKKTSELIPLCHNINLSSIEIEFNTNDKESWSVPHYDDKVIEYLVPESNNRKLTREEALFEKGTHCQVAMTALAASYIRALLCSLTHC